MKQLFSVVTDTGMDRFPTLKTDVPQAHFAVIYDGESHNAGSVDRDEAIRQIMAQNATTAQPTPQQWIEAYEAAAAAHPGVPVIALPTSGALSGSHNAAEQAKKMFSGEVIVIDSRTIAAELSFAVHALNTAAEAGKTVEEAIEMMKIVSEECSFYFTIDDIGHLRRGGRIGRVQAMVGNLLNIRPVIGVDKAQGVFQGVTKARGYKGGLRAIAAQITERYGEGTPLGLAFLEGSHPEDTALLRDAIAKSHPIIWDDIAPISVGLMVHTGPRGTGVGVVPGAWPWER